MRINSPEDFILFSYPSLSEQGISTKETDFLMKTKISKNIHQIQNSGDCYNA